MKTGLLKIIVHHVLPDSSRPGAGSVTSVCDFKYWEGAQQGAEGAPAAAAGVCDSQVRATGAAQRRPLEGASLGSGWGDCLYKCVSINVPGLWTEVQNWEELSCGGV